MMKLTLLGFNSAIPTKNSHPTAQVLEVEGNPFLIDCGEGTQVQLRKAKVKFSRINHIFISHMHGDHVFGLIGFLSSLHLLGRTKPLHIFGPKGIQDFLLHQFKHTHSPDGFEIVFHELEHTSSEKILDHKNVEVYTIPLKHRIYCNGYLFKEKPKPNNLKIEEIQKYPEIEICDYQNLKMGQDFTQKDGTVIPNEKLTSPHSEPMSYAFCSDTMYTEEIVPIIKGTTVLYHESTFLEKDRLLAQKTGHSTALDAAKIAHQAQVQQLILGHFSNRYKSYIPLLEEAQTVFPNTILPQELEVFDFEELQTQGI